MKSKLLKAVNSLLMPSGLEICPATNKHLIGYEKVHDPASSFMKDTYLQSMLVEELEAVARAFFKDHLSEILRDDFDFGSEIERFWQTYSRRTFTHNRRGSGFHNAFWIYLFSRMINPTLVVESGVWQGQTSWLLEQACPDATIHGFDIDLRNLEYKTGKVVFHEQDWNQYTFKNVNGDKSLVFFDCHINHATRIIEAHRKGFRHLLFDDNPPAHKLYAYGLPGFPTSNIIYNSLGLNSAEICWYWQGTEKKYELDMIELREAKRLLQKHEVFPDVGGPTRYGGFSFLTYVRLSD